MEKMKMIVKTFVYLYMFDISIKNNVIYYKITSFFILVHSGIEPLTLGLLDPRSTD